VYSDLEYLGTHSPEQIRELVSVYNDPYELCESAHAIAVLTEWDEFRDFDWERIYKSMKKPAFVFDGRNLLDAAKMKQLGFVYEAIGVR
jgi:UDPglucose 6-dehydrogenase